MANSRDKTHKFLLRKYILADIIKTWNPFITVLHRNLCDFIIIYKKL